MHVQITKLLVENFGGITRVELNELSLINVIVGPSNSCKSTLLGAAAVASTAPTYMDILRTNIIKYLLKRRGIRPAQLIKRGSTKSTISALIGNIEKRIDIYPGPNPRHTPGTCATRWIEVVEKLRTAMWSMGISLLRAGLAEAPYKELEALDGACLTCCDSVTTVAKLGDTILVMTEECVEQPEQNATIYIYFLRSLNMEQVTLIVDRAQRDRKILEAVLNHINNYIIDKNVIITNLRMGIDESGELLAYVDLADGSSIPINLLGMALGTSLR